ncbi:MAG: HEPN domain-containing protein [Thermodesulfobacteriota bacterium]
MIDEVRRYLEKADHALRVADGLLQSGYAPDAASKTYYAMFYAARALLLSEGVGVTKHSAVEASIGYHFAKTGKLDPKYHRMLINARKVREIADYDIDEEVIEPDATLKVAEGREFVAAVKHLLGVENTPE